jgi:hypothetical protein
MTRPIAIVLLERPMLPKTDALVASLRRRHPELPWDSGDGAADPQIGSAIFVRAGDHLLVVALIAAPLPDNEEMWRRASWLWPEAPRAVSRHRAHLMVSTLGAADNAADTASLSLIESVRLTTAVVGSLLAVRPGGLAVVWGGKIGRSAEMWLNDSRRSFDSFPDHPFGLWMDIVKFISGNTIGAYTIGLSDFIGREIEFDVDGADRATVVERVAGLGSYLIAHGLGDEFKDGTMIEGDSQVDRVRMVYRTSRITGSPVVWISLAHDTFGKLRRYSVIPVSIAARHPLLVMLGKVGLFDAAKPENQIELRADHHLSEIRLESYDNGLSGALSKIGASEDEAYAKARHALENGDIETATSLLMPFAEEVGQLQLAARLALTLGDLWMFSPRRPTIGSPME